MKNRIFVASLGCALVCSSFASAASIGINFTGGGNGGSPAISMLATDSAGKVPQANYNNFAGQSGASQPLVDDSNTPSTAALTYSAGGTYTSIGGAGIAPVGGDEKLNAGFIYGNISVTVSSIPYSSYDIYVYELNDAAGRVETTTLNGVNFYGGAASPNDADHVDQMGATSYLYTRSSSTDSTAPTAAGDYVLYSGLSGTTQTITASAPGNGYINGIQIVQTPEPGIGLVGAGLFGIMARRRRLA